MSELPKDEKFCVDCEWAKQSTDASVYWCYRPMPRNRVTGDEERLGARCQDERSAYQDGGLFQSHCGPEGSFWEAKGEI